MSKISITKAYQELAGQLIESDDNGAKTVEDALVLAQQIQTTFASQWSAHISETPGAPMEASSDDLALRLVYIADWLDFHDRAITAGVRASVPSALLIQARSIAVVTSNFSVESIAAMEKAMQQFEGLNFTGGEIKKQE